MLFVGPGVANRNCHSCNLLTVENEDHDYLLTIPYHITRNNCLNPPCNHEYFSDFSILFNQLDC